MNLFIRKFILSSTMALLVIVLLNLNWIYADEEMTILQKKDWAKPLKKEGLPNLHQVTENYYRGAQPTAAGFQKLKEMGVRTVINLRSFHSDRNLIGYTGLAYEHIYMKAWHPEEKEVVRFLQIVMDKRRRPVFVHCQHGADRTGLMTAVYRVVECGWTKVEAIKEMTQGGYGFHEVWKNIVPFIEQLDMDAIKKKAGLLEKSQ